MFTPPPSPLPPRQRALPEEDDSMPEERMEPRLQVEREVAKRWTGRRFRWAVILVPLVVVFITAWATYSTSRLTEHSSQPLLPISWQGFEHESSWRQHHKRSPDTVSQSASATSSTTISQASSTVSAAAASAASLSTAAESTTVPVADQAVPPVPSTPPTLPTPFPQPFDGSIVQNFSSVSCSTFFTNMTNTNPFRQCRPFSLLYQSSSEFINAQTNLTLMNSIIWGTCNTNVDFSQCQLNMDWFASAIQTSCAQELKDSNTLVVNTLTGLRAFEVMHDAGCQIDPTQNTYCYINAVRNSNPVDTYYYGIPLGIPLPKTSQPLCSSCSQSLMAIYATALQDAVKGPLLTALKSAYASSAALSVQFCGSSFATTSVSSASSLSHPSWQIIGTFAIFFWTLVHFS